MMFSITPAWLREPVADIAGLPDPPADETTLAEVVVSVGDTVLTATEDRESGARRDGANLSGYRLAEWLAWNWWRLRWEPARGGIRRYDWRRSHEMAGIGGGWLWPNIAVHGDGVQVFLAAKPSRPVSTEPSRYTSDWTSSIPADEFERGVGRFVREVLDRLDACALGDTSLVDMWRELEEERTDPELSSYRKLEALLGFDPDEADPGTVGRLLEDGRAFGEEAMAEVAADMPSGEWDARREVRERGFEANPRDGVGLLEENPLGGATGRPAWLVGVDAARILRRRERLGGGPLSDRRLAELYGVSGKALQRSSRRGDMAFALDSDDGHGAVLRARWVTGRRFELARLLADRLVVDNGESLRPATHSRTYRQKMQRAFASELLCPLDSLAEYMGDDYSDDARDEAANRFRVSPLAVTRILENNGLIDPDKARERALLAA